MDQGKAAIIAALIGGGFLLAATALSIYFDSEDKVSPVLDPANQVEISQNTDAALSPKIDAVDFSTESKADQKTEIENIKYSLSNEYETSPNTVEITIDCFTSKAELSENNYGCRADKISSIKIKENKYVVMDSLEVVPVLTGDCKEESLKHSFVPVDEYSVTFGVSVSADRKLGSYCKAVVTYIFVQLPR